MIFLSIVSIKYNISWPFLRGRCQHHHSWKWGHESGVSGAGRNNDPANSPSAGSLRREHPALTIWLMMSALHMGISITFILHPDISSFCLKYNALQEGWQQENDGFWKVRLYTQKMEQIFITIYNWKLFFIGVKYAQVSMLGRREDLCRMASITSRPVRGPKNERRTIRCQAWNARNGKKVDGSKKV